MIIFTFSQSLIICAAFDAVEAPAVLYLPSLLSWNI